MNIYVGNLPYDTKDEQLREAFASYGTVDEARVIMDRDSGRSKGFAFVDMSDDTEARAAIEGLNGKDLAGRALTVREARPREGGRERRSGPGGKVTRGGSPRNRVKITRYP